MFNIVDYDNDNDFFPLFNIYESLCVNKLQGLQPEQQTVAPARICLHLEVGGSRLKLRTREESKRRVESKVGRCFRFRIRLRLRSPPVGL